MAVEEIIRYLICFLLGEQNAGYVEQVAYGMDTDAKVVVVPSVFFKTGVYMTPASIPHLPLKEVEGVPVLFGNGQIVRKSCQIVVYADIIASTYFLITRYEECLNQRDRDQYGRFIGKKSLPYQAGFLMRPVVEEYGQLLRGWLREAGACVSEPCQDYGHIYLTHDVDQICQSNNLYRAMRKVAWKMIHREEGIMDVMKAWSDYERNDKVYQAFRWLADMDISTADVFGHEKCTGVYFVKGGGREPADNLYYKNTERVKKLLYYLKERNMKFGLHTSMSAGIRPQKVLEEKEALEKVLGEKIFWNRNHYLCSKEPGDMEYLISAGITDDFTMGYADVTGFRLGTCRAVRWINPNRRKLTSLTLHPLTVMEVTLDNYMGLKEEDAFSIICRMLKIIKQYHGETVLLWHNTSVADSDVKYYRKVYERTLNTLKNNKMFN